MHTECARATGSIKTWPHRGKAPQALDQRRNRVRDVRRLECGDPESRKPSRDRLPLVVTCLHKVDAETAIDLDVDEAGRQDSAIEGDVVLGNRRAAFEHLDDDTVI